MAFVKPLAVVHRSIRSGFSQWEFYDVNGYYFATNRSGGHKDFKSYGDAMSYRRFLLSLKGKDQYSVGRAPKAAAKSAPAAPTPIKQEITPVEVVVETPTQLVLATPAGLF